MMTMGHHFTNFGRALLPMLLCLALGLMEFLPINIRHLWSMTPYLLLAGCFYWLVNFPRALPNSVLFLIGLSYDLLSGNLIGLMPLTLILTRRFIDDQRRIFTGRAFVLSWWGFIIVAVSYGLIGWLLASMISAEKIAPTEAAVRILITIAAYPLVAYGLGRFQRWAIDQ